MAKIQDLLKNYPQIIDIIRRAGAQKVLIFKGFAPKEEHSFNILIMEYQAEKQDHPICRADIVDALTPLLGCTICITDKQLMLPPFYEQLNPSNSLELPLSNTPENKDQFLSFLQRIFGTEWEFVTREPYDREATEEEEQRYREQMESMRPWFEQNEREADEQEASTSRSKGVGFFTQPTIQGTGTTLQITFAYGDVMITRTISLHRTSPALVLKPELPVYKLVTACSDLLQREGLASATPTPPQETTCGW